MSVTDIRIHTYTHTHTPTHPHRIESRLVQAICNIEKSLWKSRCRSSDPFLHNKRRLIILKLLITKQRLSF